MSEHLETRHACALDSQGNGTVQAVDTVLIHAMTIVEIARRRVERGTRRAVPVTFRAMAGGTSRLVEGGGGAERGRTLGRYLDIIGADDRPAQPLGQGSDLRSGALVLNTAHDLLG